MSYKKMLCSDLPEYLCKIVSTDLPDLTEGEVQIKVEYSSLNYKDALAITGKGQILKKFPLTPGIDASGTIVKCLTNQFKLGQKVLVTGCGLGETTHGGYAQLIQVPLEWVIALPENLSIKSSMILGTAGFTAGLALLRMETLGLKPSDGAILITGASGGVGSLATYIFSKKGYEVIAISHKPQLNSFLKSIGAKQVCRLDELKLENKPLGKALFAGAVDNLGGNSLNSLLPHIKKWGSVASIGLAMGTKMETTVMPFILRGVSVLGISSTNCPLPLRQQTWELLGATCDPAELEQFISKTINLDEVITCSHEMLTRKSSLRTLIKIDH